MNTKYVFHAIHLNDAYGILNLECPDCYNMITNWVSRAIEYNGPLPVTFHMVIGPKMENLKITVEKEK